MKSQSVILLIVLVVLSSTQAFEFTNLQEVQALKKSKYATNLIETLNLSLQNKGSIDEIRDLLNQILRELDEDQVKADTEWRELDAKLAKAIKELSDRIDDLTKQIADVRKEIANYERLRDQANINLAQYREQFAGNVDSIEKTRKKRDEDKENTKRSQSEHTDVINALDEVIAKLSELVGSISGVGKFEHINATEAELRDMQTKFLQIANNDEEEASILMELATSANQDALNKLIELLKNIQESTKKSLSDDLAAEVQSEAAANELIANLQADNEKLTDTIKHQEENLRKYEGLLSELNLRLVALRKELELKKEQLVQKEKERAQAKADYEREKVERAEDKAVVVKLQRIFLERVANMSKVLRAKTAGF